MGMVLMSGNNKNILCIVPEPAQPTLVEPPDRGVHGGKWVLYGRERPYIQCVSKKVATLKLFAKIFT